MNFTQLGVFHRVTTDPSSSDSSTNSPVASSSAPSSFSFTLLSSSPSQTLRPSSATNRVPATPSTTVATVTSGQALVPSQSQSSPQSSTGGVSFFHNKTALIAVFTSVGVFTLAVILILGIVALRWKRRKDLVESALDFSPTTDHLINDDDYSRRSGGGGDTLISRSSGSLSSESRGTRPRVPSPAFGASPFMPALAPASNPASVPASIPAPREMQQRGFGTGYIGDRWLDRGEPPDARYAYANSAQPYYGAVRQPQPPPPSHQQQQQQQQLQYYQQQQLQYQPQQRSRSPRLQQQEERPLPADLPTDIDAIPASLIPSSQYDNAVFNVPFATVTKPSRLSTDGGLGGAGGAGVNRTGSRTSTRERRQTQQVPLPPPPAFPRKITDTLGRNDEGSVASVEEDRRNQPRLLKVRGVFDFAVAVSSWLTGGRTSRSSTGDILIAKPPRGFVYFWSSFPCSSTACWACVRRYGRAL